MHIQIDLDHKMINLIREKQHDCDITNAASAPASVSVSTTTTTISSDMTVVVERCLK